MSIALFFISFTRAVPGFVALGLTLAPIIWTLKGETIKDRSLFMEEASFDSDKKGTQDAAEKVRTN